MLTLSVVDIIVIWSKGAYLLLTLYKVNFDDTACQAMTFLINVALMYSVWLVVVMTFERFLIIVFPATAGRRCTVKSARVTVIVMLILSFMINAQYFVLITSIGSRCTYVREYSHYAIDVWSWIDMSLYSFLPSFFIFLLNLLIICNIRRKYFTENSAALPQTNITAMLLTVSIVFFLLTAPYAVFFLVKTFAWNYKVDSHTHATYLLTNTLLRFLADMNHCVNFFLYVLSGKVFRQDLKAICCCKSREKGHADPETNLSEYIEPRSAF